MEEYLIYGAGGHASVIADLLAQTGKKAVLLFDDAKAGSFFQQHIPIQKYQANVLPRIPLIIAVGNNAGRKRISELVSHPVAPFMTHPSSVIAVDAGIREGTVILANATVQSAVSIGHHCIINANAVIDHDAVIGDYVHISSGAYVGGGVVIEEGALIGPGAIVTRNTVVKAFTEVKPLAVV